MTLRPMRLRNGGISGFSAFGLLATACISGLVLLPIGYLLVDLLLLNSKSTLAAAIEVFGSSGTYRILAQTCVVVGVSVFISVCLGSMFAWLTERSDIGFEWLTRILPVVPMLVPPIAGAIGWVFLLAPNSGYLNTALRAALGGDASQQGPLDIFTWPGLIFVYVMYLVPEVYLTTAAGLRSLDPTIEDAARMSGAGPLRIAFTVTMPCVKHAIASGAVLASITGFALFSVPVIIGGQAGIELLSVEIVRNMTSEFPPKIAEAFLLGVFVIVFICLAWLIQARIIRAGRFAKLAGKGGRTAKFQLGRLKGPVRLCFVLYLTLTSLLPLTALVLVSLQPYWSPTIDLGTLSFDRFEHFLDRRTNRLALSNSITLGLCGAIVGMALAAVVVFFLERRGNGVLATSVDGVTKLPGALSHLVIGIAFIVTFAGAPFYLYNTIAILFLAYIVLYIPQASITARAALSQIGRELSEASSMSGAGQGTTFARIAVPLMAPGLIAGFTLLFVLMAGDVTASVMLAGVRTPVVGFVILDFWENGSYSDIAAFGAVISLITSTIVISMLWITGRWSRWQSHGRRGMRSRTA